MQGIAELQDGMSRRMRDRFQISDIQTYSYADIYRTLGYSESESKGIVQQGALTRGDAVVIRVSEKTRSDATNFEDVVDYDNFILYWLGQEGKKKSEFDIISGKYDVFFFLRIAKNTYKYLGRIKLLRFDQEEQRGISSRMIFEMSEYAEYRHIKIVSNTPVNKKLTVETTKTIQQEIRIAQGKYRKDSLELWHHQCAVTGIKEEALLIAGHIKPWRYSSNIERVDPLNSIILSPTYDKLFDRGFITFSFSDGSIIIPEKEKPDFYNDLDKLGITGNEKLSMLTEDISLYLKYHKNNIYRFRKTKDDEYEERLVH